MFSVKQLCFTLLLGVCLFSCTEDLIQPSDASITTAESLEAKVQELDRALTQELVALEEEEAVDLRSHVVLPAGSVDGLAAAIAAAGPGGTVRLASGPHYESGTVTITHRVRLIGRNGATLIFDNSPLEVSGQIEVGLHFLGASRSVVRNIDFQVSGEVGGTAILLQNSDRAYVTRTTMEDFQFGVIVEQSNHVFLTHNDIAVSTLWQVGAPIVQSFGIVVVNGLRPRVYGNKLSGGITGIWACDSGGTLAGNEFFGNLEGIILCKVPAAYNYRLPNGYLLAAQVSGKNWSVFLNDSHDNLDVGY